MSTADGNWELFYPLNEDEYTFFEESLPNKDADYWVNFKTEDKSTWVTPNGKAVTNNLLKWKPGKPDSPINNGKEIKNILHK